MSHFTLTVVLDGTIPRDGITAALAAVMERYDENREVPRYVLYTREQLIAKGRQEIEDYKNGTYADYLADPAAYADKCTNLRHLEYLSGGTAMTPNVPALVKGHEELDDLTRQLGLEDDDNYKYKPMSYEKSFPARLDWTDEQVYAARIEWYEADDIGENGEVYSERNPDSKWDWYSVGGRWAGYWKVLPQEEDTRSLSEPAWAKRLFPMSEADQRYADEMDARPGIRVDVARKCDIDFADPDLYPATHDLLTSDGEWHEKGQGGWFGMSFNDKAQEEWNAEYTALLAKEADNAWLVLVDYHI